MLRDADLFVLAEGMLVEVLGRIREQDRDLLLPQLFECQSAEEGAASLWDVVGQHARDDAAVPDVLAGRGHVVRATFDPALSSLDAQAWIARAAEAACEAASRVADDAVVHCGDGPLPVGEYLRRLTVRRCLVGHYVAAYLGSTACPLPEELARPLWERTEPEAQRWRDLGLFRPPLPLPEHVSWRDRFLLTAGHQPHPLGH